MRFFDWLILGGATLLIKKGVNVAAEERNQQHQHKMRIIEQRKQIQAASERMGDISVKRKNTPCFFNDGITRVEFKELAEKSMKRIKRIKQLSIHEATISCVVESQSGYSDWQFHVDFNDWGHLTGKHWVSSENIDSIIPNHFGNSLESSILLLLSERSINIGRYSDVVEKNDSLGTDAGINHCSKTGFFQKLFIKPKAIISQYNSSDLTGEHIYPVVSFLKMNGFLNVKSLPLKDIGAESNNFQFEVAKITIDGDSSFSKGDSFFENSEIIIQYHEKLEIIIPYSEKRLIKQDYREVSNELQSLGFTNITFGKIKDLTIGWFKKDGSVDNITVSGHPLSNNSAHKFDEEIIIYYHTFKS